MSVGYPSSVASMRIQLEDLRQASWQALYVGNRPRFATASAVRFLDARTLVCCSLLARKIYLIRFDLESGAFQVLDQGDSLQHGQPVETDLCDVDGQGHVLTSNCEGGGMSLYRIVNNKIQHMRDLFTDLSGNYCHGARFCGPEIVVATALRGPRGAHFFDLKTMQKRLYIETARLPKDICFLPGKQAVLITTDGAPLPGASSRSNISELELVTYDLTRGTSTLVTRECCDAGQLDSGVFYDGCLYMADSHGGRVLIMDANTLRQVGQIDGFDFPHGVDVRYGMLAVACYGTNSVHVSLLKS